MTDPTYKGAPSALKGQKTLSILDSNPRLTGSKYQSQEFTLGSFEQTELQALQNTVGRVIPKARHRIM